MNSAPSVQPLISSFPLRRAILSLLNVPPEPHPPTGDPASLRVFHAGRNYLRLRLTVWGVTQLLALAGLLFWTALLFDIQNSARAQQSNPAPPSPPTEPATQPSVTEAPKDAPSMKHRPVEYWAARFADNFKSAPNGWIAYKQSVVEVGKLLPAWAFPWIWLLKLLGFAAYFLQLPVTYAIRRFDYEMRWYMVTDRSLRLRQGVWKVSESTMSFSNIQQVTVSQGPIQRLLGLGDVKVQSAGGGGNEMHDPHTGEDMHLGVFHSVTNAHEIRDLVLERLRRYRETGLGDPDDAPLPSVDSTTTPSDALGAAHELLREARALRSALS